MTEDELTYWHDRAEKAEAQLLALQEQNEELHLKWLAWCDRGELAESNNAALVEQAEVAYAWAEDYRAQRDALQEALREIEAGPYNGFEQCRAIARNALYPTLTPCPNCGTPSAGIGSRCGACPIGEPGVDWVDVDHPCKRCGQIMPHTHDLRPTQETDPE